ncbi:hypothetical protein [Enhygromyxa salina]|uniref:Uncharacterized protein n=1 Tax=Enhygromyxa salina TaxID=215803 RepID=A0A2S9Y3T0_9BACT|nr:hypothetical protein [Enhygromyxa salina]PRP99650.1 hypothetical protein ENSA7_62900 [Enhygromyxa salina]
MLALTGCKRECECDSDDSLVQFGASEAFGVGAYSAVLAIDEEVRTTCTFELTGEPTVVTAVCDDATVELMVTPGGATFTIPEFLEGAAVSLTVTGADGVWAGSSTIDAAFESRLDNCLCLYGIATGELVPT